MPAISSGNWIGLGQRFTLALVNVLGSVLAGFVAVLVAVRLGEGFVAD